MKITNTAKVIGQKITETFRPKGGMVMNVKEANMKIKELEDKLDGKTASLETSSISVPPLEAIPSNDMSKKFDASTWRIDEDLRRKEIIRKNETKARNELAIKIRTNGANNKSLDKEQVSMGDMLAGDNVVAAKLAMLDAAEKYRVSQEQASKPSSEEYAKHAFNNVKRESNAVIWNMSKGGYSLSYDVSGKFGRAFIKANKPDSKWHGLVKGNGGGVNVVGNLNDDCSDINKEEFTNILAGKPSHEEITSAYRQVFQSNVSFKSTESQPIW